MIHNYKLYLLQVWQQFSNLNYYPLIYMEFNGDFFTSRFLYKITSEDLFENVS